MANGTTIGKAYVQIVPSADGIKGSITNVLNGEADSAGKKGGETAGNSLVSTLKKVVIAAGLGKIIGDALTEGGKLQQSIGGVETLYGGAADAIKGYADEAYKYGLSANDYMEQSTSFAAALKKSLGGDVTAAAEAANTALEDMADNSAKFGTDISSIQQAYQGFARGQYTLLDNLKIGYGGTKTEMERLLADAQKISGVEYNIDNLSDVYEAIHVIQGQLGLTGSAATEASSTFSGSMAAMQAALTNFLGNLSLGTDITPSLNALAESVSNFLFNNLIPMVLNIISALPTTIYTLITTAIPLFIENGITMLQSIEEGIRTELPLLYEQLQTFVTDGLNLLYERLPEWLDTGVQWLSELGNGIINNIPTIIEDLGSVMTRVFTFLLDSMPMIMQKGWELISNLGQGIINNLPAAASAIATIITNIFNALVASLPGILSKGVEIIGQLASGIIKSIPTVISAAKNVITSIINGIKSFLGSFVSMGGQLLNGLASGIADAVGGVIQKAIDAVGGVVDAVKSFFGIASPSKLFASFGEYLDLGLAKGIEDNMRPVEKAMSNLTETATGDFETSLAMSATSPITGGGIAGNNSVSMGGVNITINATDGQSARQIADEVQRIITSNIEKGKAVFA